MKIKNFGNLLSVIGLGKLGLPLASALASKGFRVTGYDSDLQKIETLKDGKFPYEPGLNELLLKFGKRITYTNQIKDLNNTSITLVIVPTPSLTDGSFSIEFLKDALRNFARLLKEKNSYHLIAIVSTVLPGSMEQLRQVLEENSGKKCGKDFGLCYNPAFIALGNVINCFLHPDFVLLGESDRKAGDMLESVHRQLCGQDVIVRRMNWVNAELTKISVNTFVTMKISFGNILARLCERMPGANVDVITQAIGSDKRIGAKYLKGAIGYGGPCFPRDNKAFSSVVKKAGMKAHGALATDKINREQIKFLADIVSANSEKSQRIGILGLAYKEDTDVIEESQGVMLASELLARGFDLDLFDPAALENVRKILGSSVQYAQSLKAFLNKSDTIIITTPWREFKNICEKDLAVKNRAGGKTIIDCWRLLESKEFSKKVRYIPLGVGLAFNEMNRKSSCASVL